MKSFKMLMAAMVIMVMAMPMLGCVGTEGDSMDMAKSAAIEFTGNQTPHLESMTKGYQSWATLPVYKYIYTFDGDHRCELWVQETSENVAYYQYHVVYVNVDGYIKCDDRL